MASGDAEAKEVETAYEAPVSTPEQTDLVTDEEVKTESVPLPVSQPEAVVEPKEEVLPQKEESVPLPSSEPVPLPEVEEPKVEIDDRKESEKTADAFAGAFSVISSEPEVQPEPEPEPEIQPEPEPEPEIQPEPESEPEDALEEAFIAADTDASGGLSIQEIAEATGLDIDKAAEIHAEADIDGDGQVTLEELKSQPEVAERMALPKPVKPVRAGIQNPKPQQQQQQQQQQPRRQ